jgi:DNA-binding XRE family transcriptional regulator
MVAGKERKMNEPDLYLLLGLNIKEWRQYRRMSQAQLAERVGLLRTSITNIETGRQRISLFWIYRLCEVFDCRLTELLPPLHEVSIEKHLRTKHLVQR